MRCRAAQCLLWGRRDPDRIRDAAATEPSTSKPSGCPVNTSRPPPSPPTAPTSTSHFIPTIGKRPMGKILPSEIQRWVTTASAAANETGNGHGLFAASVRKYHTMLHSVFERALRDRVVTVNPCAHTELPKVI